MTTNKPEVVAWIWDYRGRHMATTDYSQALELAEPPYPTEVEPLIRLTDHERLQAKCARLQAAMIEAKGHISHYMYGGSNYREPAAKAVALIDGAMQEVT